MFQTCEYVLGVESRVVCDLLAHADPDTGIFPVDIVDTLGNTPDSMDITKQTIKEHVSNYLAQVKQEYAPNSIDINSSWINKFNNFNHCIFDISSWLELDEYY